MNPIPVGRPIRVVNPANARGYAPGQIYTVAEVDTDGTFRAADASGKRLGWLRWEDCEPAGGGIWDRVAGDLPEELVIFLSCFDGIADLELDERILDAALATVPDLHERVVAAAREPDLAAKLAGNRPVPVSGDRPPKQKKSSQPPQERP
jgi:hypothetical protein